MVGSGIRWRIGSDQWSTSLEEVGIERRAAREVRVIARADPLPVPLRLHFHTILRAVSKAETKSCQKRMGDLEGPLSRARSLVRSESMNTDGKTGLIYILPFDSRNSVIAFGHV